ncbi:hypothetical protein [Flavobacterium reichenbachii]|uniref:LPXTG cell wall anchor domain-containing protein n=1 Tax=Flavobacterium reichenbachii TaxID=362418 RepID=A0A085ZPT8_9FLAO|nr:hypothetical protein [Flavobacterium reichenbachii]KFF06452.1 hypothetical protein IW19_13435 [Flavobacterium reichenbachii]OXB11873.1 hypothetical protein B0A68_20445 [Flavobacterium reichenbachii]
MKKKDRILSLAILILLTCNCFATPPAPGDPPVVVSIDKEVMILFAAGIILGFYLIWKRTKKKNVDSKIFKLPQPKEL